MSLFEQLTGSLLNGALGNNQGEDAANPVLNAVMALIEQQGGLAGLIAKFQSSGLGNQAASWVGTGANLPLDADQLQSVLGSDSLTRIAGQLGIDPGEASGSLAQLLPQIIDQLTPNGRIEGGDALQQGLSALGGLFGGK